MSVLNDMRIRRATTGDIDTMMAIQKLCYPPEMNESESTDIFTRVIHQSPYCYVVMKGETICGYMLAHLWKDMRTPPPLHSFCLSDICKCCFIHDVAIHPAHRGKKYGYGLVHRLMQDCPLATYSLVSVNDSVPFWKSCGFCECNTADHFAMQSYGKKATYMVRYIV